MKQASSKPLAASGEHALVSMPCLLLATSCLLSSCVPLDQLPPGSVPSAPTTGAQAAAYEDLDANHVTAASAHFTINAYSQNDLDTLKPLVENLYNKIGNDLGLYTFLASGNFTIFAYRDKDEYLKKTRQPSWSHAVASGKGIYFYYPNPEWEPLVAHQMTHLIFEAYLGEKAPTFKWLEEGLAMYEELAKMTDTDRSAYAASKVAQLRQNRMPFSQMTFFVTNSEEKRRTDSWYQQVESAVSYLLAQGSPLAFAQMLGELRSGFDIDRAL